MKYQELKKILTKSSSGNYLSLSNLYKDSKLDKFQHPEKENSYYLELVPDANRTYLIIPQPVAESKLVQVPRKVTSVEWQNIRHKGPKFEVGTKIKDKRGCVGLTAYPYLSDDGIWDYPLAKTICPSEDTVPTFSHFITESEVEKMVVSN
jgi:hypothetical protein